MLVEGAKKFGRQWNITVESNPICIKNLDEKLSAKSKWKNFLNGSTNMKLNLLESLVCEVGGLTYIIYNMGKKKKKDMK
jgi:hypothetical protein